MSEPSPNEPTSIAPKLSEAAFPQEPPDNRRGMLKKLAFIVVIVLLAVGVSAYTVHAVFFGHSVSATGYLQPDSTSPLNFATAAPVVAIGAEPGDVVHKGQVLAKQDVTALQAQLDADQAALAADRALVAYAENPTDPTETQALQLGVAAAQAQLKAAQTKAADTTAVQNSSLQSLAHNVAAAQATLASDQQQAAAAAAQCESVGAPVTGSSVGSPVIADLSNPAQETPPPESTTTTRPKVTTTTTSLTEPPVTSQSPSAQAALINSCTQLAHRVAQDQADVVQAQGEYNQAAGTQGLAVDSSGSDVTDAQNALDTANTKAAGGSLDATPSALATAQASLNSDTVKVATDRKALNDAVLVAPYDGVVTSVGGVVGTIAGPDGVRQFSSPQGLPQKGSTGIQLFPQAPQQSTNSQQSDYESMVTIASVDTKVVAQVSETELSKIDRGDKAHISFPALRGTSVTGIVTRVEPQAVNQDGKVYFLVDLSLVDPPTSLQTRPTLASSNSSSSLDGPLSKHVVGITANVSF